MTINKYPDRRERCVNHRRVKECPAVVPDFECRGEECPFYCTHNQRKKNRAKTAERLRTLPPDKQAQIATKYYPTKGIWWAEKEEGKGNGTTD